MLQNFIWFWIKLTTLTLHCQNQQQSPHLIALKFQPLPTRLLPSEVQKTDNIQLLLYETPTHILIINQQLPLSPSNSFLQFHLFFLLPCAG
jgi:hypothetical protein